jgi:hypothetical protein
MQENARLNAEVERLRNLGIKLESMIDPLEGRIERLTKAGDDCAWLACFHYDHGDINKDKHSMKVLDEWEAAKEGKQS